MPELTVSTKGQIVLPAEIRRRLGLGPGSKLEIVEGPDGITLRPIRTIEHADVAALAGMIKARSNGRPRNLDDFDAASYVAQRRSAPR
jgi:antitoxin PrlF